MKRIRNFFKVIGLAILVAWSFLVIAPIAEAQIYYGGLVSTNQATGVNRDSATLSGTVNPNGQNATAWFEYGTTQSLGQRTQTQNAGSGTAPVTIVAPLTGLQSGVTYFYRAVAQGQFGIQYGNILSFQTAYANPGGGTGAGSISLTTGGSDSVAARSVTLHGTIVPNGQDVTAWFEYGTTQNLGRRSPTQLVSAANKSFELNYFLGGLQPGTTYYYELVAQGPLAVSRGLVRSFRTAGQVAPEPQPEPEPEPVAPPVKATTTVPTSDLAILTASMDKAEAGVHDELNYALNYKNPANRAVSNVKITVTFPAEFEYVIATLVPKVEGNQLVFAIGSLRSKEESQVLVRFRVKDTAKAAATYTTAALMSYDASGQTRFASANTPVTMKGEAGSDDSSDGWPWYVWLAILLISLILIVGAYIFYRYMKSRRAVGQLK